MSAIRIDSDHLHLRLDRAQTYLLQTILETYDRGGRFAPIDTEWRGDQEISMLGLAQVRAGAWSTKLHELLAAQVEAAWEDQGDDEDI